MMPRANNSVISLWSKVGLVVFGTTKTLSRQHSAVRINQEPGVLKKLNSQRMTSVGS